MNPSFSFCRRVPVSTQSQIRSKFSPYSTIEKCAVLIFDKENIQTIELNRKDTGFVDIARPLGLHYNHYVSPSIGLSVG